MCGIAGILRFDRGRVDPHVVSDMCDTLVHRGPDALGVHQPAPWLVLGHRRLSIIDLESGEQPMSNEDGTVWITFNGEIFNYRELRRELRAKGHVFRTESDTEVIVHLYEQEGPAGIERLNGQYAFALWDGERLFCARDPMGIKPLYFAERGPLFAFASEPRALLEIPELDPEPDLHGLHLYFRYRFVPSPVTAFRGVRKLRPGEWLSVDATGQRRGGRLWRQDAARVETLRDPEQAIRRIRQGLETAVERQLVADVPVGAFLSGGLDSSSVVALAARASSQPLRTYSIGFEEAEWDERGPARQVAEHCGTRHTEEIFGAEQAAKAIPEVLDHLDEPFGDTSILPTWALCRLAARHQKVVLSGDGGDELFAGYNRFYKALQLLSLPAFARPLFPVWRRFVNAPRDPARWRFADTPALEAFYYREVLRDGDARLPGLYGPALRDRLRARDGEDPVADVVASVRGLPPLARLLSIELHTILSEYHLVKVDRASMQNSLEVRVPLLDVDFVAAAFALSPEVKLAGGRSKGPMRQGLRDLLPPATLARRKKGFSVPFRLWFAESLAGVARERLEGSLAVDAGLVDARAVASLLTPARGRVQGSAIWRLLVLEAWLRRLREARARRSRPRSRG